MRLTPLLLMLCVASWAVVAQGSPPARFDVVSVKPNTSLLSFSVINTPAGGGINATHVPVALLLRFAYQMREFEMENLPSWARTEFFDVIARPAARVDDPAVVREMVRGLLADRFALLARIEPREAPVFALLASRRGRLGQGLVLARKPCVRSETESCGVQVGAGEMSARAVRMSELAPAIAMSVDRSVIDATGLDGLYDVTLTFVPEWQRTNTTNTPDPGPSIFTALEEQLGLTLDPRRALVPRLIIDRLERPAPD